MSHPTEPTHSTAQKLVIILGFIILGFVMWEIYGMWNGVKP